MLLLLLVVVVIIVLLVITIKSSHNRLDYATLFDSIHKYKVSVLQHLLLKIHITQKKQSFLSFFYYLKIDEYH